jgi:hypothetical protein
MQGYEIYENDAGKFVTLSYKVNEEQAKKIFGKFEVIMPGLSWRFINLVNPDKTKLLNPSAITIISWEAEPIEVRK